MPGQFSIYTNTKSHVAIVSPPGFEPGPGSRKLATGMLTVLETSYTLALLISAVLVQYTGTAMIESRDKLKLRSGLKIPKEK